MEPRLHQRLQYMAAAVCATLSATVGTPSTLVPGPCGLGISTALTGGRKAGPRTHPVGSPGGIAPPGSHRSRRDSLPSPGSSHPVIQAMVVHCQWLRRVGSRFTTPVHHAMARLNARSRLYFLRAHRRM